MPESSADVCRKNGWGAGTVLKHRKHIATLIIAGFKTWNDREWVNLEWGPVLYVDPKDSRKEMELNEENWRRAEEKK